MSEDIKSLRERLQALSDPNAKPDQESSIVTERRQVFHMTAGELRQACQSNMDHPLSPMKIRSVEGLKDSHPIAVEAQDLEAILDDKDVQVVERKDGQGKRYTVKKCVPRNEKNRIQGTAVQTIKKDGPAPASPAATPTP